MNILRRMALATLGTIMLFALLGAAWSHVTKATLGNRDAVKRWLNESQFYDRVATSVLEQASKGHAESDKQSIPVDDPNVRQIVNTAFSPDFLQRSIESVLDGTYNWLEGNSDKPEFRVDLADAKQRLADGLGNYAVSRAASLPACTAAQSAQLSQEGFDALNAPCLPPGVNPQTAAADLRNQIITSEDFLGETSFSGDDLKVTSNGREVSIDQAAEFKRLQSAYQAGLLAPLLLGLTAVAAAVVIVFLSSSKKSGLIRAGLISLTAGLLLAISWGVLASGSNWLSKRAADLGGESSVSRELAADMVQAVIADITGVLRWYAIGLALLGLALIVGIKVINRGRKPEPDKPTDPTPPADDSPKEKPVQKAEQGTAPAKKQPRKIQL